MSGAIKAKRLDLTQPLELEDGTPVTLRTKDSTGICVDIINGTAFKLDPGRIDKYPHWFTYYGNMEGQVRDKNIKKLRNAGPEIVEDWRL